jgi:hypothetical protein
VRVCASLQSGGMAISPERTNARTYGRVLVLLGIRNELRARRTPIWRQERNRIEIDRALADLADAAQPMAAGSAAVHARPSLRLENRLSATP